MAGDWGDLPDSPIRLEHLDAGSGEAEDGWIHCKTVPFCIIAQAVEGTYTVQSPLGRVTASDGEVFIMPAGIPLEIGHYARKGSATMKLRFLHCRYSYWGASDLLDLYELPLHGDKAAGERLGAAIQQLLDHKARHGIDEAMTQAASIASWAYVNELAYRVLGMLLEDARPSDSFHARIAQLDELKPLLGYIHSHLHEPLDIAQLLAQCHYSRSALFTLFQRTFRQTPMHYIQQTRLTEAYRKLCTTTLSVAEVAESCGFPSLYHFSRVFKARFGQPPTLVRRDNRMWEAASQPD